MGLVALLIPQGMAYAELAGLPPVTGLYTTVLGLLAYAVFGPSRTLILGPDSSLAPLIFAAIVPLVASDAPASERVALAGMLALLVGVISIAAGLFRLGVLADLLSMPMRVGYLNGIGAVVLVSQLPRLCGFSTDADGFVDELRAWVDGVIDGDVNTASLVIGLACLAIIVGFRVWDRRIPGVLIAVVGAAVVVGVFGLVNHGVAVVGTIPEGFPSPSVPHVSLDDIGPLVAAAIAIVFITMADTIALSRSFTSSDEALDADQELAALGTANVAAGFFQGFPLSASSSRTAVAQATGARSQLTGVIGAAGILVMLVAANGLTRNLPTSSLAAIVIAAGFMLFDLPALVRLARVRRSEFVLAAATFLGVVLVGVLQGIAIAAGLSIANVVRRAWRPYNVALGRVEGRKGYHDVARHPEARQIPGLVLFRFDAPLFFANAEYFANRVRELVSTRGEPVHRVIVAAEPISDIDTTAADVLLRLVEDLNAQDIELVFAELKGPVKDRLDRYGIVEHMCAHGFPPTLGTAIDDYVDDWDIHWVDWEERPPAP